MKSFRAVLNSGYMRVGIIFAACCLPLMATAAQTGLEAKVTLRAKSAPLAAVLDQISSQSGLNFVLADGLEDKRVTLLLSEVTARDALEALRLTSGITYWPVGEGKRYAVGPQGAKTPRRRTRVLRPSNIPLSPQQP